jgi:glucokinase
VLYRANTNHMQILMLSRAALRYDPRRRGGSPVVPSKNSLTVVVLESQLARVYECGWDNHALVKFEQVSEWDSSPYQTDEDGRRLFEEITRRTRTVWDRRSGPTSGVAVSMPGMIIDSNVVLASSRLGIRQQTACGATLAQALGVKCRIFHDVECIAIGEDRRAAAADLDRSNESTLVYVFVDEGVGSKAIIDGKVYRGAGSAGVLGRLIVQPHGAYFREMATRGSLETYASRPWVSENLVAAYRSELNKKGASSASSHFRGALSVAADRDWRSLTYENIAEGINDGDPIANSVIDLAANYLGLTIGWVITILHPHQVVLGGGMISELPTFADRVVDSARHYCWANAWNATEVSIAAMGRDAQVEGAIHLWLSTST